MSKVRAWCAATAIIIALAACSSSQKVLSKQTETTALSQWLAQRSLCIEETLWCAYPYTSVTPPSVSPTGASTSLSTSTSVTRPSVYPTGASSLSTSTLTPVIVRHLALKDSINTRVYDTIASKITQKTTKTTQFVPPEGMFLYLYAAFFALCCIIAILVIIILRKIWF